MDLLQNIFKIYLYPVDKTITLTHLDDKMILDFFYLEMTFLLTPEPYYLYQHFKNVLQNIFLRKPKICYFYGRRKKNIILGDNSLSYSKCIVVLILCTNIQHPQKYSTINALCFVWCLPLPLLLFCCICTQGNDTCTSNIVSTVNWHVAELPILVSTVYWHVAELPILVSTVYWHVAELPILVSTVNWHVAELPILVSTVNWQ